MSESKIVLDVLKHRIKQGEPGYWNMRRKRGQPKKLEDPQMLWDWACVYFDSIDSNPYKKQEIVKGGWLAGAIFSVDSIRPYTWNGLECLLYEFDIIAHLDDYKSNKDKRYNDYIDVVHVIGKMMFDQKFNGAAIGAFDPRIIAMELGMSAKQELKVIEEQPLFPELSEGPDNGVIDITGKQGD